MLPTFEALLILYWFFVFWYGLGILRGEILAKQGYSICFINQKIICEMLLYVIKLKKKKP